MKTILIEPGCEAHDIYLNFVKLDIGKRFMDSCNSRKIRFVKTESGTFIIEFVGTPARYTLFYDGRLFFNGIASSSFSKSESATSMIGRILRIYKPEVAA